MGRPRPPRCRHLVGATERALCVLDSLGLLSSLLPDDHAAPFGLAGLIQRVFYRSLGGVAMIVTLRVRITGTGLLSGHKNIDV